MWLSCARQQTLLPLSDTMPQSSGTQPMKRAVVAKTERHIANERKNDAGGGGANVTVCLFRPRMTRLVCTRREKHFCPPTH